MEAKDKVGDSSGTTPVLSAFAHRKRIGQGDDLSEQGLEDDSMVYVYQDEESDDDGDDDRLITESGAGIYGAYSLLNPQLQAKQVYSGSRNRQHPSTFQSWKKNPIFSSSSTMSYCMADGETLVIVGQFSIKITKGTVEYLGAKLVPDLPYPIAFSPRSHSIPVILACKDRNSQVKMSPNDLETYPVCIEIGSYFSGIEHLADYAPTYKDMFTIDSKDGYSEQELDQTEPRSFNPVYRSSSLSGIKPLCSEIWNDSIDQLLADCKSSLRKTGDRYPVILVCGPKSVGKSSFCVHLLNSLITKGSENLRDYLHAGYMELDPGQPYFSPPGVMSLNMIYAPILGPSFTQIYSPDDGKKSISVNELWAHQFGYTSAKPDPDYYMQIFRDLYRRWSNEHAAHHPLIINTAGWMKGLGQELILQIINEIRPSHVVALGNNIYPESGLSPTTNGVADLSKLSPLSAAALHVGAKMLLVDSASLSSEQENYGAPLKTGLYSASQLRTLQMLSYLHVAQESGKKWDFLTHMTAQRPWLIPFDGIDGLSVIGLDVSKDFLDKEDFDVAFNGTIVGITSCSFNGDKSDQVDNNVCKMRIYNWSECPIQTSKLLGLGLIKAIDYDKREVHMHIPWLRDPERQLSLVPRQEDAYPTRLVVVRGRIPTPLADLWNVHDENNNNKNGDRTDPWLEYQGVQGKKDGTTGPLGAHTVSVRHNIMRRSMHR